MVSTALNTADRFRIGRVFQDSFAVIGRNLMLCIGLGLVFYALPYFGFSWWFWKSVTLVEHGVPAFSAQRVTLSAIGFVGYVVLVSLLRSALIRVAVEDLSGRRPSIRECIRTAVTLLLPTIGINLLSAVVVLLGFALLIVPGLMVLTRWFVAVPVLVQERRGVMASLKRSRDLTSGSRWPLLAVWVVVFAASTSITLLLRNLIFVFGIPSGFFISAVLAAAEFIVGAVGGSVAYVELRRVKEGTSVDELAEIFS